MKKLSLILFLAAFILGVYGCDGDSEPTELPDNSFELEQFGKDNLLIYDIYYNDYDDYYYMLAYDRDKHAHNIYQSSDEGQNFTLFLSIADSKIASYIVYSPKILVGKDGYIYVAFDDKFYRFSADLTEKKDLIQDAIRVDVNDSKYYKNFLKTRNQILAIDSEGFIFKGNAYKSSDNGDTWRSLKHSNPILFERGFSLYIKRNIMVAYYGILSNGYDRFYISSDKGETWSDLTMQYKDIDSSYFAYYDVNNITSVNTKPYTIKKSDDKISNILGIDKYGNVIGETFGKDGKLFDPENSYYFSSSNMGESWKYHFYTYLAWSYYTPSGYLYFGTMDSKILRSKNPLK